MLLGLHLVVGADNTDAEVDTGIRRLTASLEVKYSRIDALSGTVSENHLHLEA